MYPCAVSTTTVAIYTRMSQDGSGDGLGVQRQEEACRAFAAEHGWAVEAVYRDNDISATTGKVRPGFEALLRDKPAALVCWHQDRLLRVSKDLERILDAGITVHQVTAGTLDLATPTGRAVARTLTAWSTFEGEHKAERQRAANRQRAEAGRVAGGGLRPFGFEPDRRTIRESEADVIRQMVPRFLAGESLSSLATWLGDSGVATVTGGEWRTPTVRALLSNPRYAGLRAYHGEVLGTAEWPAIITRAQHEGVLHAFAARKMEGRRAPRRYVLSGLLRCAKCGGVMFSQPRSDAFNQPRTYACRKGPDHNGCGGTRINAEPVEEWITEAVLLRLDSPAMHDALTGRSTQDGRHAALVAELHADRTQLEDLARLWADRTISAGEWKAARSPIEARIRSTEQQLAMFSRTTALDGWVGNGRALRDAWQSLNLTRQAAIIRAVIDHITVGPGKPGGHGVDFDRLTPTWSM